MYIFVYKVDKQKEMEGRRERARKGHGGHGRVIGTDRRRVIGGE